MSKASKMGVPGKCFRLCPLESQKINLGENWWPSCGQFAIEKKSVRIQVDYVCTLEVENQIYK